MLKEQKNTQSALGWGWGGGPRQDFQKHLHFTFPRKTASFAYVVQRGLQNFLVLSLTKFLDSVEEYFTQICVVKIGGKFTYNWLN